MKLQAKVILIMAITWLIICGIIYAYFKFVTTRNYEKLEAQLIQLEIQDTQRAYEKMLDALTLYAQAYSVWDEAYDFMIAKNKRFISSNFTPGIYTSANIDFMMYYDLKGKLYHGGAYDAKTNTVTPIPTAITDYLQNSPQFITHTTIPSNKVGLLNTKDGLMIMASQPVVTSDSKGPSRGSLIMGYRLTPGRINNLSSVIGLQVTLFKLDDIENNKTLRSLYTNLNYPPYNNFTLVNYNLAHGIILLKDIHQQPVGILQVDIPRIVYKQGIATSYNYLALLMASGFLVLLLTWYLLKVFILGRIISINDQISQITQNNDFNSPIKLPGKDELSSLATSINHMIDIITESQARLDYLATYDSLTQIPNRSHFHELLTLAIANAKLSQNHVAVMFIDMDKLKKVNDTYGHSIGDKLIQTLTQRMKRVIKASDVLARQSGDEFLMFIENIQDEKQVSETALRILETTLSPFVIDNITLSTSLSIGISLFPSNGTSAEELIKNADHAMYRVKTSSGNGYRFYEEGIQLRYNRLTSEELNK